VAGGTYRLYGLSVRSPLVMPCPPGRGHADVTLVARRVPGPFPHSGRNAPAWFASQVLADGSTHLHWRGLADVVVSPDGTHIAWQPLSPGTQEIFRGHLLSQVLSFSLLARGMEPLHASAVAVDGKVIAFLGNCGLGKSSLTAAFLAAGYPLVTDDLLVLRRRRGRYVVEAGLPRIKLFPHVARRLLGARARGPRMAAGTAKLVLPVPPGRTVRGPLALHTLYVLERAPSVCITPVAPAAAFLEILRGAFNTVHLDRGRLASQFVFARQLAATARVRRLGYPRRLAAINQVRDAILKDSDEAPVDVTLVTPARRSVR